ncbi:hypothetical protein ACPV4B_04345 [Vibrio parahaemolyticus]
MKKNLFVLLVFIIFLAAAGGTTYYLGDFNKPEREMSRPQLEEDESESIPKVVPNQIELPDEEPQLLPEYYYVSQSVETVYTQPDMTSASDGVAYYGEKLEVMERQGDWIRIAPIYQLEEGAEEVSQWLNAATLSDQPVALNGEAWLNVLTEYVDTSDDFIRFQDVFLQASTALIKENRCRLSDFKEVRGWIKSINFSDNVYFTYCGGIDTKNKVYLNVASGEVF